MKYGDQILKSEEKLGFFKLGIGESSSKERMDYMSVLVAGRRREEGYDKQMAVSVVPNLILLYFI